MVLGAGQYEHRYGAELCSAAATGKDHCWFGRYGFYLLHVLLLTPLVLHYFSPNQIHGDWFMVCRSCCTIFCVLCLRVSYCATSYPAMGSASSQRVAGHLFQYTESFINWIKLQSVVKSLYNILSISSTISPISLLSCVMFYPVMGNLKLRQGAWTNKNLNGKEIK